MWLRFVCVFLWLESAFLFVWMDQFIMHQLKDTLVTSKIWLLWNSDAGFAWTLVFSSLGWLSSEILGMGMGHCSALSDAGQLHRGRRSACAATTRGSCAPRPSGFHEVSPLDVAIPTDVRWFIMVAYFVIASWRVMWHIFLCAICQLFISDELSVWVLVHFNFIVFEF